MLLCKDEDLVDDVSYQTSCSSNKENVYTNKEDCTDNNNKSSLDDVRSRLKELKDLRDQNLISEDEYNELKAKELTKL